MVFCPICGELKASEHEPCSKCGAIVRYGETKKLNKNKLAVLEREAKLKQRGRKFISTGGLAKLGTVLFLVGLTACVILAVVFVLRHQAILLPP